MTFVAMGPRSVLLLLTATLGARGTLLHSVVSVDNAEANGAASASRVFVDEDRPVILHAVDGKLLPVLHVSNRLRSITYLIRPGTHVLWLSSTLYGLPFVPQRIKCFVLHTTLSAATEYRLRFDTVRCSIPSGLLSWISLTPPNNSAGTMMLQEKSGGSPSHHCNDFGHRTHRYIFTHEYWGFR